MTRYHPVDALYRVPVEGIPVRKKKPLRCWVRELVQTALRHPDADECQVVATVEYGAVSDFIDIGQIGQTTRYLHYDGAFWCDHVWDQRVFPDAQSIDVSEAVFDVVVWSEAPDESRYLSDVRGSDRRPATLKADFPLWWTLHRQRPGMAVPRNQPHMAFSCANLVDGFELLREILDRSKVLSARQVAERILADLIYFEGRVFVRCPLPTFRVQPRFEICPLTSAAEAPDYPFSSFGAVREFYWENKHNLAKHCLDALLKVQITTSGSPDIFDFDEVGLYAGIVAARMVDSLATHSRTLSCFAVQDFADFCLVRDQRGKGLLLQPDVGIESYVAAMAGVVRGILRARQDSSGSRRPDMQDEVIKSFRSLVNFAFERNEGQELLAVAGLRERAPQADVIPTAPVEAAEAVGDPARWDGPPAI